MSRFLWFTVYNRLAMTDCS